MDTADSMPPLDDLMTDPARVAMQAVYERGFDDGRAKGYVEGVRAAQAKLGEMLPDPIIGLSDGIEELDLTVRTYNCLKREGIHTVRELLAFATDQLLEIRNLSEKGVTEIDEKLLAAGYTRTNK